MTKEEKIKEAYGEYWEIVKNYLDEYGWCRIFGKDQFAELEGYDKDNSNEINWRPKSLQGIENNNGWIKIEEKLNTKWNDSFDIVFTDKGNIYTYATYCNFSSIYELEKINVLSLFDGMSCGQIALNKLGIEYNYYASEIKNHAIKCTQHNFPNTIQLGNVREIKAEKLPKIDLLIGGSPCQDFSIGSKDRKGLEGEKSSLFYEYLRLLKEVKPTYFLLENVEMTPENKKALSDYLGVEPIFIDSIDFSFQTRKRYYWTNIPIQKWIPKKINFQDFKDTDYDYCKQFKVNKTPSRELMWEKKCPNVTNREYVNCLTVKQDRWNNAGLVEFDDFCRYLTRRELELAQTVPVGYTNCVSIRQAEDLLGDGWTVDVIAHIFSFLRGEEKFLNSFSNKNV